MKIKFQLLCLLASLSLFLSSCSDEHPVNDPVELPNFDSCLTKTGSNTFDIITWNLKQFPIEGQTTIESVAQLILDQDPDLIAVQEIKNLREFDLLLENLPGWDGQLQLSSDLNLGYLYKKTEVTAVGDADQLFKDNSYAFPRAPLLLNVRHHTGLDIFLINIHLKCCDGSENEKRRREASQLLKEYLDERFPENNVIVLGDFNDEILPIDSAENVFYSFMKDSLNYTFADMDIAGGDEKFWSYPSWPSHIDHILITDELFDRYEEVNTLSLDFCDQRYFTLLSDHRPLMIRLE